MTSTPTVSSPNVEPALRHRIRETTLTVRGADGAPLADAEVTVEQVRHAFGVGNIGFDFVGTDPSSEPALAGLADLWLDVFNTATLPFYWGRFEPTRGEPDTERLLATARWLTERGVALKGHPLVWHTIAPSWLGDLPTDEVERVTRERIRREVSDFAGLVEVWDAINEVVIMPVFDNEAAIGDAGHNAISRLCLEQGRIAQVRMAFEEARAANPAATLLINDFDLSTAYECLIEGLLEGGIEIDAIGLQSHMHQGYWGEEKVAAINERFARYGLPLHWTETTLVSGDLMPAEIDDLNDYQPASWPSTPEGEERQADEIVRHYRSLAAHPSVQVGTYWGITDAGAWLGAPGGLVRLDGTPKPAYDALRRLVKEDWWVAPTTVRTDAEGRVTVRGWAGDYRVSTADGTITDVVLAG